MCIFSITLGTLWWGLIILIRSCPGSLPTKMFTESTYLKYFICKHAFINVQGKYHKYLGNVALLNMLAKIYVVIIHWYITHINVAKNNFAITFHAFIFFHTELHAERSPKLSRQNWLEKNIEPVSKRLMMALWLNRGSCLQSGMRIKLFVSQFQNNVCNFWTVSHENKSWKN